jgi:hypothetical protein
MRRPVLLSFVFLWALNASTFAVENGPLKVTIVRAEQKTHDRVVYWQVNTPLYREDPYFEVTVRAGRTVLVGEYEPRSAGEMLPEPWKPGAVVQARIEKRSMYLKRPNGSELRFVIVKRTAAKTEATDSSR